MSAHDNDDVIFRLLAFVIMAGCLVLAASIPDLFADGKSTLTANLAAALAARGTPAP